MKIVIDIPVDKIPNKATNGDVIKAMFPNATFWNDLYGYGYIYSDESRCLKTYIMTYNKNWWNAPYKMESEVEDDTERKG